MFRGVIVGFLIEDTIISLPSFSSFLPDSQTDSDSPLHIPCCPVWKKTYCTFQWMIDNHKPKKKKKGGGTPVNSIDKYKSYGTQ